MRSIRFPGLCSARLNFSEIYRLSLPSARGEPRDRSGQLQLAWPRMCPACS